MSWRTKNIEEALNKKRIVCYPCLLVISGDSNHEPPITVGKLTERSAKDQNEDLTTITLQIVEDMDYSPGVHIEIEVSYLDPNNERKNEKMYWSSTAINAADDAAEFNKAYQVQTFSKPQGDQSQDIVGALASLNLTDTSVLKRIIIQPPKRPHDWNLFTGRNDFGSQSRLVQLVRTELRSKNAIALLCNSAFVERDINKIKDPLNFKRPREFCERSLSSAQNRLSCKWLTKVAFTSIDEFIGIANAAHALEHLFETQEPDSVSSVIGAFFEDPDSKTSAHAALIIPNKYTLGQAETVTIRAKDTIWVNQGTVPNQSKGFRCIVSAVEIRSFGMVVLATVYCEYQQIAGPYRQKLTTWPVKKLKSSQDMDADVHSLIKKRRAQQDEVFSISLKTSETTYQYRSRGMSYLKQMAFRTSDETVRNNIGVLLGSRIDELPVKDMFGNLGGPAAEIETYLADIFAGSNDEQQAAFNAMRNVHGGIHIIDGCAGSGKSHFMRRFMKAHLFRENKDGRRSKILIPVATNLVGDETVTRLVEDLQSEKPDLVILRGYKIKVEYEALKSSPAKLIPSGKSQKDGIRTSVPQKTIGKDIKFDEGLITGLEDYMKKNHISLGKVKSSARENISSVEKFMSVGALIAQKLGLDSGENPLKKSNYTYGPYQKDLRTGIVNLYSGKTLEEAEAREIIKTFLKVLKDVLDEADVLICTTTQALDDNYCKNFNANIMIIDEASQVNDMEFGGLIARYPNTERILLAGDCRQHGVYCNNTTLQNSLRSQWILSLHERFQRCGFSTSTFFRQMRCKLDIASLISDIYYENKMIANNRVEDREACEKVLQFNNKNFNVNSNVVFIDIPDARCECLHDDNGNRMSNRRYNEKTAACLGKLLEKLGEEFEPANMIVLSPYVAQQTWHEDQLRVLKRKDQRYDAVQKFTMKGVQGRESEICILDLTVDKHIGFLEESSQTLVGTSRGSNGLYILGNKERLKWMNNYSTEAVGRLVQYCERQGLVSRWAGARAEPVKGMAHI